MCKVDIMWDFLKFAHKLGLAVLEWSPLIPPKSLLHSSQDNLTTRTPFKSHNFKCQIWSSKSISATSFFNLETILANSEVPPLESVRTLDHLRFQTLHRH
jgi:hypothetical protein